MNVKRLDGESGQCFLRAGMSMRGSVSISLLTLIALSVGVSVSWKKGDVSKVERELNAVDVRTKQSEDLALGKGRMDTTNLSGPRDAFVTDTIPHQPIESNR